MNHTSRACLLLFLACSCAATVGPGPAARSSVPPGELQSPDLALTMPPYAQVHANWKQRLDQPYVFVEWTGSYTQVGEALARVDRAMRAQALEPSGPPFALYYDDPGTVPTSALRARACFPVDSVVTPARELAFDVLESTTVVYAFVGGAYPDVPRAYPGLYDYMRSLSWTESGPIRESYLVDPASVSDWSQLVTEVQIPASMH
ncbi:MAG TPA: GyrI-like domain-containing protein [Planctomycetota bacterium]|nr:GyrI-like domain-containing protein [Planctomycetota bacterium]